MRTGSNEDTATVSPKLRTIGINLLSTAIFDM
jgi:hypothetical protein